ncbi:MAG: hypothetical protein IPM37_23255 [Hahellaceae bacterium]|nr:hypothetical protein [Hahellaceae bacterium]
MDYILREIVKNSPDTHISDELLQVADYMEKLEQRLAYVEEELDELDKELFIFASDVIYFKNDKMPDWLIDKAKAIYYRPRLGKGEGE